MARKPTSRRPRKADVKAAADRAEARAKGEPVEGPMVPVDPTIIMASEVKKAFEEKAKKAERKKRISYSAELAIAVCARMLTRDDDGKLPTLRDVCAADDMPAESTVYEWLSLHGEFSEMYARAREERAHMVADEIVHIADTEPDPNKARIRIDARKWWAGKANARHYGERSTVDLNLKRDPSTMDDHELELIAAGGRPRAAEKANGTTQPH